MDGASTTTLNGRNYLTTSGDKAHGIEVYAAASSKGSEEKAAQVKVGSDSTVYTQGNQSHGVYTDKLISVQQIRTVMLFMLITVGK